MNFAFIRCECGRHHFRGVAFCVWCGNQPPTSRGRSTIPAVPEEQMSELVACCTALNEALKQTGGKWAVA